MLPIIITSNNHICSFVKGCTVFKQCWRISIGEYLIIKMEPSNSVNIYTVSVNKDVKEFSWMLSASDFHWIFCSFRLSLNSRFVINFPRFFKPLFRPILLSPFLVSAFGWSGKSYFQKCVQLLLWIRVSRIGVNNMICRMLSTHVL